MAKVRADQVKRALSNRHKEDFFLTEVKSGPTHYGTDLLILDALAIKKSWANPCITGYEVKVDRSDFTRDDKWNGYMNYCHQFSFACPTGLIQPDELPEEVGLVYYKPETGTLYTKRKAVYRSVEIPSNILMYIIMNRLDNERHPFFSNKRQYIEAYLADKEERSDLGRRFAIKAADELRKLREEIRGLKRDRDWWEDERQVYEKAKKLLGQYGINVSRWNDQWADELHAALAGSSNPRVIKAAQSILSNAEELNKILVAEGQ